MKNIKTSCKNNKFKISPPTWNEEFKLLDGSYSISDIQDYFEYLFKKHGEKTFSPSIRIYINKMQNRVRRNHIITSCTKRKIIITNLTNRLKINRVMFKIKTGNYLEFLIPAMMKLLGSTKSKIAKDENGENLPYLEIAEVELTHCNVVNNSYQQNSRVLYTFVPNKLFGQLLDISPENFIF